MVDDITVVGVCVYGMAMAKREGLRIPGEKITPYRTALCRTNLYPVRIPTQKKCPSGPVMSLMALSLNGLHYYNEDQTPFSTWATGDKSCPD